LTSKSLFAVQGWAKKIGLVEIVVEIP